MASENATPTENLSEVKRLAWKELLKRVGPGMVLTGVVVGPGSITTASVLGGAVRLRAFLADDPRVCYVNRFFTGELPHRHAHRHAGILQAINH